MSHPSESGHFYYPTGEPCYWVRAKDGSMRPTTVRDARKLGLYPSVTGIIRCADRPGLNRWMQEQVLLAALTLPRKEGELDADFCKRVLQDSGEQARQAADRGTAIHAAIQGGYEGKHPGEQMLPYVLAADTALTDWAGNSLVLEAEKSFGHPLGFGGKVDLHGHSIKPGADPFGPQFVVDFKTKEFDETTDLKTWDEHALQLAAYREGLGLPTARCAIVYVSTSTPGLARLLEVPEKDLARGWAMFRSLLSYWQAKNNYFPNEATGQRRKHEPVAGAIPATT